MKVLDAFVRAAQVAIWGIVTICMLALVFVF